MSELPIQQGGLRVLSGIVPASSASTYGTHYSYLGVGGYVEVPNIDYRNSIPPDSNMNDEGYSTGRRRYGMMVYVIDEDKLYRLFPFSGGSVVSMETFTGTSELNQVTMLSNNNGWIEVPDLSVLITGGTYFSGNSSIVLYDSTGGTVSITGITTTDIINPGDGRVLVSTGNSENIFVAQSNMVFNGTNLNITGGTFITDSGGSLHSSAIIQFKSTTKGVLLPGMTTSQKNAIVNPTTGLTVYDSTIEDISVYTSSGWTGVIAERDDLQKVTERGNSTNSGLIISGTTYLVGSGSTTGNTFVTSNSANTQTFTIKDNGNILIGTTTDSGNKLDVNGNVRIQAGLTISNVGTYALSVSNGTTSGIGSQYFNAGGILYWGVNNVSGDFLVSTNGISYASFFTTSTRALQFGTNQTARMTIFPTTGNIGINTITDAGYKLDVNGSTRIVGSGSTTGNTFVTSNSANTQTFTIKDNGNVLIGTTTDGGEKLYVNGNTSVNGNLQILNNGGLTFYNGASIFSSHYITTSNELLTANSNNTHGAWKFNNYYVSIAKNLAVGTTLTDFVAPSQTFLVLGSSVFSGSVISSGVTRLSGQTSIIGSGTTSGSTAFSVQNSTGGTLLNLFNNGNLNVDNGALYVDGDNGRVGIGTSTLGTSTELTVSSSQTASSAIARGQLLNTTLVAAANNDVLVGLDINPTFTNGAFTGVQNWGLRVQNSNILLNNDKGIYFANSGYGISGEAAIGTLKFYTNSTERLKIDNAGVITANGNARFGSIGLTGSNIELFNGLWYFNIENDGNGLQVKNVTGSNAVPLRIFKNNNITIGTTTDAGYKLDVNGTVRFQDNLLFSSTKGIYATDTLSTILQSSTNYFTHNRVASSGTLGFQIAVVGNVQSFWRWNDATGDVEFGNVAGYGLQLYTNNLSRVIILSNGNVLIGTTTNAGYKLDVSGSTRIVGAGSTSGSTIFTLQNSLSATTVQFRSDGVIGISSASTFTTQVTSVISASTTNSGIAIVPNGTGAFTLNIPDGTATGGNARGQYAIDLQLSRTVATQVASGDKSIVIGNSNTATNTQSIVIGTNSSAGNGASGYSIAIGTSCNALPQYSVVIGTACTSGDNGGIAIGNSNFAAGYSVAMGSNVSAGGYYSISLGKSNSAASDYSTVSGGQSNTTSSGTHATVIGGLSNTASGQYSIVGGQSNTSSTSNSSILGGWLNINSGGSYGSIVGGRSNVLSTSSWYTFIGGGWNNGIINGDYSVVVGGFSNSATTQYAAVIGGSTNRSSGLYSLTHGLGNIASSTGSTSIGFYNTASGTYSVVLGSGNTSNSNHTSILGGVNNNIYAQSATIVGGSSNLTGSYLSFIGGGNGNYIANNNNTNYGYSSIVGGNSNKIGDDDFPYIGSFIGGGLQNKINATRSFVGSGYLNRILTSSSSFIGGGESNTVNTNYSVIVGGTSNTISTNDYATIVGGSSNTASGQYSIAGGQSNTSSGSHAVSFGSFSTASALQSFAVGTFATASGWRSFAQGQDVTASADFSMAKGYRATAYLYGQTSFANSSSAGYQQSYLTSWGSFALTSGSTVTLSLDGSGTANLIIPNGNNRTWNVVVNTITVCTVVSGGTLTVGDAHAGEYKFLFKRVGGTSTISPITTSSEVADTSMATASFSFSAGTSQQMAITFNSPNTANNSTFRAVAKVALTEVAW